MKFNLKSGKNPIWKNSENTLINLEVTFVEFGDEILPFTAHPDDVEEHGRDIYARAINGEFGAIADYVPPTTEQLWRRARDRRDDLLTKSDILVLPDRWATYTEERQTALSTYRQALRDITTQSDPSSIVWPILPT
jgi:hypothetical protein